MNKQNLLDTAKNYVTNLKMVVVTAIPIAFIEGALNMPLWELLIDNPTLGLVLTVTVSYTHLTLPTTPYV